MKIFNIAKFMSTTSTSLLKSVSEEEYYEMLEVLPPNRMTSNAFLVGEPYDHNGDLGQPRYQTYYGDFKNKVFAYLGLMTTKTFDSFIADELDLEYDPECEYCGDTGETTHDEYDSAGQIIGVGTISSPCICKLQYSDRYEN